MHLTIFEKEPQSSSHPYQFEPQKTLLKDLFFENYKINPLYYLKLCENLDFI